MIDQIVDSVNSVPDDIDDWPPDRRQPAHLEADDYNGLLELEEYYHANISKMITQEKSS